MTTTSLYPIQVDGVRLDSLAYNITDLSNWRGLPNVRSADVTVPGRHGVIAALSEDWEAPVRTLGMMVRGADVNGAITTNGRDHFDKNLDALFMLFGVRHRLLDVRMTMGDASVRQRLLKVSQAIAPTIDGIGYQGTFVVQFLQPDVFDQDVALAADWGPITGLTNGGNYGITPLAGSTAPIEDAIIMLEGPVTNPTLVDSLTQATLTLTGTLAAGDRWRVDCGTWSSTRGTTANTSLTTPGPTNAVASTSYQGSGSRFLALRPDASKVVTLGLAGTGITAATALSARARRKFL